VAAAGGRLALEVMDSFQVKDRGWGGGGGGGGGGREEGRRERENVKEGRAFGRRRGLFVIFDSFPSLSGS
jgi:hypothetical protein